MTAYGNSTSYGDSCVMCSIARPTLVTVPSILSKNRSHFECVLQLHTTPNPDNLCKPLEKYFPMAPSAAIPPVFTPVHSNHTCLTRSTSSGTRIGHISDSWCMATVNVSNWMNSSSFPVARADLWWYCGSKALLSILPRGWIGTCTIISLIAPVTYVPTSAERLVAMATKKNPTP